MPKRLLIVEDHPIFGEAIQAVLQTVLKTTRVDQVETLDAARARIDEANGFDLVLLDLRLPDSCGLEGLIELRALFPRQPIAVISAYADSTTMQKAEVCGASGFIPKSVTRPVLVETVRDILRGKTCFPSSAPATERPSRGGRPLMIERLETLTGQQMRVLRMLCAGMLNKQIAHALGVGETTVKAHVGEILRKLAVASRTQAVIEVSKVDAQQLQQLYAGAPGMPHEAA